MIVHTRLQIMLLVDAVEERIGAPVEAWPTSILTILFAFDPHMPFALHRFTKVIAFRFGNAYLFPWHVYSSLPAASFHHTSLHHNSPTYTTIGPSFRLTRQDSRIMICRKNVVIHRWHHLRFGIPTTRRRIGSYGLPHDGPPHFTTGEPAGMGRGRLDITCTFVLIKVF